MITGNQVGCIAVGGQVAPMSTGHTYVMDRDQGQYDKYGPYPGAVP